MSQTIEAAMAQAKAGAAKFTQDVNASMGGQVAQYGGGGAVAAAPQRGALLSFDDLDGGAINVAGWLKLSAFGMTIGADKTLFEEFDVIIDLSEIGYHYAVRFGNPVQYRKSYDRVSDSRGGSWMQSLADAARITAGAAEYRSADIPFYPLSDIKSKSGQVLIAQGEAMGTGLSMTAFKGFSTFLKQARKAGINIEQDKIQLKIKHKLRTNDKNPQGWGEIEFGTPTKIDAFPWEK